MVNQQIAPAKSSQVKMNEVEVWHIECRNMPNFNYLWSDLDTAQCPLSSEEQTELFREYEFHRKDKYHVICVPVWKRAFLVHENDLHLYIGGQ